MIPFGLSKEQFQARYRRCLERASEHLIDELRRLFSISVPDSVKDAEVQIFLGEDGLDTPEAWIYYRGENNKVDHSDPFHFSRKIDGAFRRPRKHGGIRRKVFL
jgi:hypothetical protein